LEPHGVVALSSLVVADGSGIHQHQRHPDVITVAQYLGTGLADGKRFPVAGMYVAVVVIGPGARGVCAHRILREHRFRRSVDADDRNVRLPHFGAQVFLNSFAFKQNTAHEISVSSPANTGYRHGVSQDHGYSLVVIAGSSRSSSGNASPNS